MENACSEKSDGEPCRERRAQTVPVRAIACREDSTKMQPCLTHRDGEHVLHREVNEAFGGASARWTRWIQIAGGMVMSCQDQSVVPTVCEHQRELTTKKAGRCKDTTAQLDRSENSWTCPMPAKLDREQANRPWM